MLILSPKRGIICKIYGEQNNSDTDLINYDIMCNSRPITVNSILAKLITRLITVRLTAIVERENILQDSQFGFRAKRSTQDAVMILNTVITQHKLDMRINVSKLRSDKLSRNLFICFIDLEKARMFDLI